MKITKKLLTGLQTKLKIGNRRGVHLNAIPGNSRYKFDLKRLAHIDENLPEDFIQALLSKQPLRFKINWNDGISSQNYKSENEQLQLINISKSFENLINQTETIELEKGINTFGFGFPVLIRKDKADNKLTVSPILIWSLKIKRTKELNTWEISRKEDDSIYLNEVLINHLQNDLNIGIEQIPSEMLDDGLIDQNELVSICARILQSVTSGRIPNLENTLSEELKKITKIKTREEYENRIVNSTDSFIDFGGLFSIFEVQKQNIIDDYDYLLQLNEFDIPLEDFQEHAFQPISSIETDPSQQGILHAMEKERNILIQGPPGTGKSQTLTAILVNALENNKKTIVVCEKRTALDVLHEAMEKKGLGEYCVLIRDVVKDRRIAVDSVRKRTDYSVEKLHDYTQSKENLESVLKRAGNLISLINNNHKAVGKDVVGKKTWTHIVGEWLNELRSSNSDDIIDVGGVNFSYTTNELDEFLDLLAKGQPLYTKFKRVGLKSFLNPNIFFGDNPFLIEQKIHENFNTYTRKNKEIKELINTIKDEYFEARRNQFNQSIYDVQNLANTIRDIFDKNKNNYDFHNHKKIESISYKLLSLFSATRKQTIYDYSKLQENIKNLARYLYLSKDLDFNFKPDPNEVITQLQYLDNYIKLNKAQLNEKLKEEFKELDLLSLMHEGVNSEKQYKLQEEVNSLIEKINLDGWLKTEIKRESIHLVLNNIESIINRKKEYFQSDEDLFSIEFKWYKFNTLLSSKQKKIIEKIKDKPNWEKAFLLFYLNSSLISSASTNLPTDNEHHTQLNHTLQSIENKQLQFIKEFWASVQNNAKRRFEWQNPDRLTVTNLYNKRRSNRFNRLSLRQIIQKDPNLFTAFFPIIFTSPDIASNLFKGKNGFFDIVMFDEASQLKLEDNLPAILKGKQVIIAGDEHQMPPSNYFSKVFDGLINDEEDIEEEEEDTAQKIDLDDILLSCESLLDFGMELKFEKKFLDFHYRSKHPFLIDFSNHAFYEKRLNPLPNEFDYIPIKHIQVNGTFSDHTNVAEAEMVLSIIDRNINRFSNGQYPTLGIATFNIAQRNLIKSKILERQQLAKYADFNAKIQELEDAGMFIKNLENIQGDERDIIILSTTYGTGKNGKFMQRFGPINHKKGYKLLNVIITRAKYKIYCCSSIPENIFLNYKEYLTAEGGNNRRAVFYAYLAYCKAVSESDCDARLSVLNALTNSSESNTVIEPSVLGLLESPFEEEVYQRLVDNFGPENLIPQLQFAGFRIDIVYDPKRSDGIKIAIECDGAKYHSSREAYLYDRHRQKILENHGFVFHRIWSTNWWKNPDRETRKLVEFINDIKTKNITAIGNSNEAIALKDEVVNLEEFATKNSTTLNADILQENKVKINSKVSVKYLDDGISMVVHIVSEENSNPKENRGQKIFYRSPLAASLLGHAVGDIVKIIGRDKTVQILNIE